MSTPANALDITQAGLVKFDGSTTFSGVTVTNHDVLVGSTSNGITSVGPGSAGQILRSGGASADPAYSTATYPATAGTAGNVLTSDGTNFTSALPFGYSLLMVGVGPSIGLTASTTWYFVDASSSDSSFQTSESLATVLIVPAAGTIKAIYGTIRASSGASAGSATVNILINSVPTAVTTTYSVTTSGFNPFSNNALSIAISAGDRIEMQLITPAWVTAPLGCTQCVAIYVQ